MTQNILSYMNIAIFSLILISLGINFFVIFNGTLQTLGIIFLASGVLLFIISILIKKKWQDNEIGN